MALTKKGTPMGTRRKLNQQEDQYGNRTEEKDRGNRKARRIAKAQNRVTTTVNKTNPTLNAK
tara:strand:+ start:325 stop:510 length:186 start_codon:yes stop_codon:yes gene_type:complete